MTTTTPETASPKRAGGAKAIEALELARRTLIAVGNNLERGELLIEVNQTLGAIWSVLTELKAQTAPKYSPASRELAAYEADIYKAKRNARVAKKGALR